LANFSFEEKTINSKLIYQGKIVNLKVDEVRLPNGKTSFREVIEHPGAAAVLAITPEKKVVLVRQYRYSVKEELLEVPAGKIEANEDPLECAKRELEEETGYVAENFKLLTKYYTSVGYGSEILYLYLATGLKKSVTCPDREEFLEVMEYDLDQIKEILKQKKPLDSKTLISFLILQQLQFAE
jgi:ADP-ribose pyrophosphatase